MSVFANGKIANSLIAKVVMSLLPAGLMMCAACSTSPKQKTGDGRMDAEFIPAAGHDNGWVKRGEGPVLGSPELGTCFDVNVIPDGYAKYNMYFSWRPKKAIALSRSEDGINWTDPEIVLEHDEASGWEDDLNRSCTLFLDGVYHMWYTGQARGYSKIGYAVSND